MGASCYPPWHSVLNRKMLQKWLLKFQENLEKSNKFYENPRNE